MIFVSTGMGVAECHRMELTIAQLGQPALRDIASAVATKEVATTEFQQLIDDMISTLEAAGGVGLAGPQVFQGKRVFVGKVLPGLTADEEARLEVFINPVMAALSPEKALAWEGCLSFMELLVLVPRYRQVHVEYINRLG